MVGNGKEPMKNFSIILKACYQCYAVADILKDQQELLFLSPLPQKKPSQIFCIKNLTKNTSSHPSSGLGKVAHLLVMAPVLVFCSWVLAARTSGSWPRLVAATVPEGCAGTGCSRQAAVEELELLLAMQMWYQVWDEKKTESAAVLFEYFFFWNFGRLICTVGHQSIFMFITKAVDNLSFLCFTLLSSTLGQLNSIFTLKSSLISCCLNRLLTSTDFGFPWGMDGQSSRANLRLPPDILPITLDTLQSEFNIAHVNSSFSRLPCSGRGPDWKRLAKCQHKQDFFLTCGTNLGCYGVVDSVTPGDEQLPGDEAFDFSGYLLPALELIPISLSPAEVAGGQPPQGSGDVPRVAGQGGNGHCPRVWVKHNRMMIVRTTTGTPGQPGMATIHGCRQMKSEGLRLEAMVIGWPICCRKVLRFNACCRRAKRACSVIWKLQEWHHQQQHA